MYIKLKLEDLTSQNLVEKISREKSDSEQGASDLTTAALLGGAGIALYDPTHAAAESFSSVNNKDFKDYDRMMNNGEKVKGLGMAAKKGVRGVGRMARGTVGKLGLGLAGLGAIYGARGMLKGTKGKFEDED